MDEIGKGIFGKGPDPSKYSTETITAATPTGDVAGPKKGYITLKEFEDMQRDKAYDFMRSPGNRNRPKEEIEENIKFIVDAASKDPDNYLRNYMGGYDSIIANRLAGGGRAGYETGLKVYPKVDIIQTGETPNGFDVDVRDITYGGTGIFQGNNWFGGAEGLTGNVKVDVQKDGDTLFKDTMSKEDTVNFIAGLGNIEGDKFQIKSDKDFENISIVFKKTFAGGGIAGMLGEPTYQDEDHRVPLKVGKIVKGIKSLGKKKKTLDVKEYGSAMAAWARKNDPEGYAKIQKIVDDLNQKIDLKRAKRQKGRKDNASGGLAKMLGE